VSRELPLPGRQRWQPLRAGLADLFYYDVQEFWFRDGRLLLRGNNGTGKSKVLALTLPFLLDGDLSAHRVEPDADPKKRMEWNLLLGGDHPYPERLGYSWLEFGRVGDDGAPEFRTIGCGLKAVAGRGVARHWFFVTTKRVGAGLCLVDPTGTALTRDRLADAIGEHGTVYDRAAAYRRAVDEALFGLGEQRYGALVDLLVKLRQPQLSKRPSERALSAALTEALPPLDQAVVADVAEAFRSLEEDREALDAIEGARRAAGSFLGHYRRYARIAARRRAAVPRRAQAAYEAVNRELAEARAAHVSAEAAVHAAETELAGLAGERVRLTARAEALRDSEDAQDARRLDEARQHAHRYESEAGRAAADRDGAAERLARRRDRLRDAEARLVAVTGTTDAARGSTRAAADAAGLGRGHAELDERLGAAEGQFAGLRREAEEAADRQGRAVEHVADLLRAVDEAGQRAAAARRRLDELESETAELAERRRAADTAVQERAAGHVAAVRGHLETCVELEVDDAADVLAALELWVGTLHGTSPLRTVVDSAARAASGRLARVEAGLAQRDDRARMRASDLTAEIDRLEAGEHTAPPAPYTRDPAGRTDRPGAPLWQLVDFAEAVGGPDRAGIEAALEAAGILDAWLMPSGDLVEAGTGDVVLRSVAADRRPVSSLGSVLRPAVDRGDPLAAAVGDDTVRAILDSIGLRATAGGGGGAGGGDAAGGAGGGGAAGGAGAAWIDPSGRFQLGVLHGAWRKPAAVYVGRGAREAARRARLEELRAELSTVRAEIAAVTAGRQELAERLRRLAAEAQLPDDGELRSAHTAVSLLTEERDRLAGRVELAGQALADAGRRADDARRALLDGASELGLPAERSILDRVREGIAAYRVQLAGLWPALTAAVDAARQEVEAREEADRADREHGIARERATEASDRAAAAQERYDTLSETVGEAVAELQRRLGQVAEDADRNEKHRERVSGARDRAVEARGKADGLCAQLSTRLDAAVAERAAATESMRRFAATGLLTVALPDLEMPAQDGPWAPDPTVRIARQIDRDLADAPDDDPAWDRSQRQVTDELKSLTDVLARDDNRASARLLEDGIVVEVVFRGRPTTVSELVSSLQTEVADRARLLDEREREILENHLVNEVASTLQELISDAEMHVARMNTELAERPTSTGMRLRLRWRPDEDGPTGLAAARERLLRQTSDAWSHEDRAAVGGFLQDRIEEVRARDAAGTWLEHLAEALDYRRWHRFVIERHQQGQWRSATGPASGGERVLAASVPLFAAASSHYASAGNPYAPRLITLDEAFAGVDDNARANYLGLLTAFDLDVVMTSEREWGCYPQVPGIAIAQLARTEGVAAVLVTAWEWDGHVRSRVDQPTWGGPTPEPVDPGLWP
jgi:uncharacterized protein (TIGR02680 family)